MITRYLDLAEAATYLGISEEFLRSQCKMRLGPAFTKPSERKYLFLKADLDEWVSRWRRFDRPQPKA